MLCINKILYLPGNRRTRRMFQKQFRVKSNTQLRGSDRKRLKGEILQQFLNLTEDDATELLPSKEPMNAVKITTHSDDLVTVYLVEKTPVLFEIQKVLYPTVCMLWKFPNLLPTFTIWPPVYKKLAGGADLMLPGIVLEDGVHFNAYGKLEKGDRIAINMTTNLAPVAIGTAALSSYDMYMANEHGKAVKVLHVFGDQLWVFGDRPPLPDLGPPSEFERRLSKGSSVPAAAVGPFGDIPTPAETPDSHTEFEQQSSPRFPSTPTPPPVAPTESSNGTKESNVSEDTLIPIESMEELKVSDNPQEAMDRLLEECFLRAWKTSAKKVDLPLLTSNFFKLHMIPACPSGEQLDVKKSSYKKLSKFLSEMEKRGIIKVKEITKGVESITSINMAHPTVKEFVVDAPAPITKQSSKTTPTITELYATTAGVLPVFSQYGIKKGDSLSLLEIRKHITSYVKTNKLQDPNSKNMVTLDPLLQSIIQNPVASAVTWEDLIALIVKRMTHSYKMTLSGEEAVAQKGKLEPIDIQVAKRTGNKKVTLINNLELYGINIQEFARECQHGVAASTSISSVPGKKSQQLLVQGNQILFVGNLLMGKYQIPKRYLRGLENAPKQKK